MRTEQRLADIDVAEACDHALIEQRCFQAGLLVGAGSRQHRGVEFIAERLGTEALQKRFLFQLAARDDLHIAKAARIVEDNSRARRHVEHDMVMRAIFAARMVEFARRFLFIALIRRNEPDMPRCISSTSPDPRSASRYLARRPRPVTVWPSSRATKSFWNGNRRSFSGPRLSRSSIPPWPAAIRGGRSRLRVIRASDRSFTLRGADVIAPLRRARYGPAMRVR